MTVPVSNSVMKSAYPYTLYATPRNRRPQSKARNVFGLRKSGGWFESDSGLHVTLQCMSGMESIQSLRVYRFSGWLVCGSLRYKKNTVVLLRGMHFRDLQPYRR
jgi:hypothetical protein